VAATDVTVPSILPSRDRESGFWAATTRNGYDAEGVWAAASEALAAVFGLRPVEVRNLLDSELGELLGDDIVFIEGGACDAEAIEDLIRARLDHLGWRRVDMQAIDIIRAGTSK
jgi:hypothetical protein